MTYSRDAILADSSLVGADGVMGSAYVDMKENRDLSGNLGGYVFIGVGSENMKGRNDIEGRTKIIKATDMSGVGAGGANVSSKIVNLFSDLFTTASATNSIIEDVDGQIKRADQDKFVKYKYKKYSLYPKYIYSNEAEIKGTPADTMLRRSQIEKFKTIRQYVNMIQLD